MCDSPEKQTLTEVYWVIGLTLIYLIGWILGAYYAPSGRGLFGFPLWFELACLYLPALFILAISIILKTIYLKADTSENTE